LAVIFDPWLLLLLNCRHSGVLWEALSGASNESAKEVKMLGLGQTSAGDSRRHFERFYAENRHLAIRSPNDGRRPGARNQCIRAHPQHHGNDVASLVGISKDIYIKHLSIF